MNFLLNSGIKGQIISIASDGPIKTTKLLEKIPGITKQAFYGALRSLKKEEVVVVHNKIVSVNIIWLSNMSDFFAKSMYSYTGEYAQYDFLGLNEGEKIKYYFASPVTTDAFWSHCFYALVEKSKSNQPLYIYNPHEWFFLVRRDNERKFIDQAIRKQKQLFITVLGGTYLDAFIDTEFTGQEYVQYDRSLKTLPFENNYYVNVIDDFVIEVWMEKDISNAIEDFYNSTKNFGDAEFEELSEIVSRQSKTRFVVSRNKKRAEKIKRLLRKNFV